MTSPKTHPHLYRAGSMYSYFFKNGHAETITLDPEGGDVYEEGPDGCTLFHRATATKEFVRWDAVSYCRIQPTWVKIPQGTPADTPPSQTAATPTTPPSA